ncbi:MAG: hypothetical protein DRI95_10030 [Bacteroidetes bacterium]|nr:MAG: hypothetical protein DRI95_10030 [Bacteroidota bacterium]
MLTFFVLVIGNVYFLIFNLSQSLFSIIQVMIKNLIRLLILIGFAYFQQVKSQIIEVPVINYVTVEPGTQRVQISWQVNNPLLIDGYVVKRQIFGQAGVVDGSYNTIETINNPNQTTYVDISVVYGSADPANRAETYRIAAFKDNGGVIEFGNMSESISSILLNPISFDQCLETNTLSWSQYDGFYPESSNYYIYYLLDTSLPPVLLDSITNGDTSYIHNNITLDTTYHYLVQAYNNTSSNISHSNIQSISTVIHGRPQVMNADYATIETLNQVDLSFTLDPNALINRYVLLRSDSVNGTFDTIANYPASTSQLNYSESINAAQEIVYYKVIAINDCNIVTLESNIASNILLEAYPATDGSKTNILQWTSYQEWLGDVDYYEIYRSVDGNAFSSLTQISPLINTYTDDITNLIVPTYGGEVSKGHFCYYILAYERVGNPYDITGTSQSNISCAHQETVLWIPNAFNPMSQKEENRTFKPVISFVDDYSLIIYDRNGSIVFNSSDPLEGWDGKGSRGSILKQGTYVFLLKYRTKNNKFVEKSGQINLIY